MELNNYPTSYDDDDDNDGGGGDGVNTLGFNQQSRDKCNGYQWLYNGNLMVNGTYNMLMT